MVMAVQHARFRYRIYPDAVQCDALARTFGSVRVVFNDAVAARRTAHAAGEDYPTGAQLSRALTASKSTPERAWLSEVSSVALQQGLEDANRAYRNFFASIKGERAGRRVGAPKFRSRKDNRQGARFTANANFKIRRVSASRAKLTLPKMGELTVAWSRDLPSNPTSVTIIHEADGRYYASFVVTRDDQPLPATARMVGIDLGLTDLAAIVATDGTREKIGAPRHYRKAEHRLAIVQRQHALRRTRIKTAQKRHPTPCARLDRYGRKVESLALTRSRQKVAAAHRKVREARLDHHHKLAHRIVHENQVICLETLGITGLARTRLAKSIHDAAWGILVGLIEEKAARYGRTVVRINRFEPTSQTCAVCGVKDGKKTLDIRVWECGNCGARLDRDYNAAVNVMVTAGQAETLINACGEDVRLQLAGADLDETGTTPYQAAA